LGKLIRSDFHIHTIHSECGEPGATPWATVRAAQEAGLEAIALTDHVAFPAHFSAPKLVREQLPADLGGVRVYVGCEAEMLGRGKPSISREYAAEMDLVLFSASHLHNADPRLLHKAEPPAIASFVLDLMVGAIETGYADILAHPFHVPLCRHSFGIIASAANERDLRDALAMTAEAGVAMETNPRFLRQEPAEAAWLFRLFMEMGCKVAINSDTHHPSGVGCRGPKFATEAELRAIGISEEHLFSIEERRTRQLH